MVSSGFQNVCACLVHIQFQSFCKSLGLFFGREAGYVGVADRIFLSHTQGIFLTLCIGHFREIGLFCRWHNVQGIGKYISRAVRKRQCDFFIFSERNFLQAEVVICRSVDYHVAQSGRKRCFSLCIGCFVGYGEEFSVIVNLELYVSAFYSFTLSIYYRNSDGCTLSVVVDDVDFRIVGSGFHHFFRSVVCTEYFGVHQHTSAGRSVEPS